MRKYIDQLASFIFKPWLHEIIAFLIAIQFGLQKIPFLLALTAWEGLTFCLLIGLFVEYIRTLYYKVDYDFNSLVPWLVGGFIACALMTLA